MNSKLVEDKQEQIRKARTIVEWFDDWEWVPEHPSSILTIPGIRTEVKNDEETVEPVCGYESYYEDGSL